MLSYDKILKDKITYYGKTEAAYEFAAEEFAREYHKNEVINRGPNGGNWIECAGCGLIKKSTGNGYCGCNI